MYTHVYESFQYCFGLVRPHQQITRQQNHEISDLLLHNPGQYCFLATLQTCFVHVCVCVHVGVRLHVYVCVHDQVCLDICASMREKGREQDDMIVSSTYFQPHSLVQTRLHIGVCNKHPSTSPTASFS